MDGLTGQSLLEGAVSESKEQTWLLCKNRVNNNSGTLTVPVTFMAGARGEGDQGVRGGGKEQKKSPNNPKTCKEPQEGVVEGFFFCNLAASN